MAMATSRRAARQPGDPKGVHRLAQLSTLYAAVPVGLCFLDTELRFLDVNARFAGISGLPPAAHLGRAVGEVVPQFAGVLDPMCRRVLDAGEAVLDVQIAGTAAADPTVERTWLASGHLVSDERAGRLGVTLVLQDITDRRRMEHEVQRVSERLSEREAFLRTIGDRLPRALFFRTVHYPDGSYHFTEVSQGLQELAGLTAEHLFAHPSALTDLIVEEDRPSFWNAIRRSLEQLSSLDEVVRMRWPDGSLHWCHFRSNAHALPDGTVALEGVKFDITAYKRAELDALHNRRELARVSRITTLGEIAASLAHELNQPLAAILNNAQAGRRFMATGQLDLADTNEMLCEIVEDCERAGQVIRRLRAWLDRDHPARQACAVSQVIDDVAHLIRSELILRHVRLTTDLADLLPEVLADRVQLQQVLFNLVLNGIDAMSDRPPGERQIVIRVSCSVDDVQVAVRDSGTGISPQHMGRIFDAFFSTKPTGLGMGLRICSSIVGAHGGRIWAANNDDIGATLFFTLPVASHA